MDEYVRIFDLTEDDLSKKILGVGDGPASFNAEMNATGRRVISCDPIYIFTAEQIRQRVTETHDRLVAAATENHDLFLWRHLKSPQDMGRARLAAMETFLADMPGGLREGRYISAALPSLPFGDDQFDLALCSHFLFLYSDQLSAEFHFNSMVEMVRVAKEARVFPLLMLGNTPSPHVEPICARLGNSGYRCEIRKVPYEFQRGGDEMLVVTRT